VAFRFKDLMINVVPPSSEGQNGPRVDRCFPEGTSHTLPTLCWLCKSTFLAPFVNVAHDPEMAAEWLNALKAQLKRAIVAIEEQEKDFSRADEPRSIAEIETLQDKLNEALEELGRRKRALSARKSPPPKRRKSKAKSR
jgi:hypothetical protein